jgi:hypothetical protein
VQEEGKGEGEPWKREGQGEEEGNRRRREGESREVEEGAGSSQKVVRWREKGGQFVQEGRQDVRWFGERGNRSERGGWLWCW